MYEYHIPHTFIQRPCQNKTIPQPFENTRIAGSTPSKTKSLLGRSVRVVWFRLDRLREMGLFRQDDGQQDEAI